MKKIIPLLACIIIIQTIQKSFSQDQKKVDSLLNVLRTAKEDTNKIITLNELGYQFMGPNPDTAITFSTQALRLAEKIQWKRGIARAYFIAGWVHYVKGDYPLSLESSNKALAISEELKDKKGQAGALMNIANVYDDQGDYSRAIELYFKALKLYEDIKNKRGIAVALGNLALAYSYQKDFDKALYYDFKAIKMAEESELKDIVAMVHGNIGIVYGQQGDLFNDKNDTVQAGFHYSKALEYFFRALKMNEELNYQNRVVTNLQNIGNIYNSQGNYPKALDYYFRSLKLAEDIGQKRDVVTDLLSIGSVYRKTGKFKEAEDMLKKSIALADSIGVKDFLAGAEERLSQVYETTGNYKLALERYKKAMILKDTIFNQEKNKEITRKEMNYEFDKKEAAAKAEQDKKDAVTQQQIQKQRTLKYSFMSGLALVIILFFFMYSNYTTKQKLKMQTLRNKIASDLHDDVGSTLSSIALFSDVAKEQSMEVMPMLQNIGDSSRKMLESMADIVWTINPENDNFEKIILRMRSFAFELLGAKKIDFDFKADDAVTQMKLSMEARKNLYLIFKEAINNMVKYSEANRASFSITGNKNNLTMLIRDNGKGFDTEKITQGNGLKNMKKRADEIGGKFLIESETGNGTTIQLILKAA